MCKKLATVHMHGTALSSVATYRIKVITINYFFARCARNSRGASSSITLSPALVDQLLYMNDITPHSFV